MKKIILLGAVFLAALSAWGCAAAASEAQQIARGKYLVEQVGMCSDCHSPRNEKGEFDQTHWLQGSQLSFAPTVPIPVWAPAAPAIAGLPNISEEDALKILETGKNAKGEMKRPPMPQFRMSHEDATAVVAYLKSLGKK